MRIAEIKVQRFRSLHDCHLRLKPLNLFIGPNGSGKSNLFKALRFLHTAVAGDAREWEDYSSLVEDLLWYGLEEDGRRPKEFGLWLKTETNSLPAVEYDTRFRAVKLLSVAQELLIGGDAEGPELSYLRTDDNIAPFSTLPPNLRQRSSPAARARSSQDLLLRDWGPGYTKAPNKQFYEHIASWRFLEVNPALARAGSFIPAEPEDIPGLEPDASNLSAFLYALQRLESTGLDAVTDAMRRSIELPESLVVEHDRERGGSQARYRFKEVTFGDRLIPPESMSDGTIRLLAHMSLLLADRSATMACIEEPDAGLHPRLMLHLADALRLAVQIESTTGLDRQVLVTTQSAELMDCFDVNEESDYLQVFVVDRDNDGKTYFTPVESEQFAPWLEDYRLGEAVRRNFV
jgi:predicted ATPase